jgi:hypothetical protein
LHAEYVALKITSLQIAVIGRQTGAELGGGLAASDRDVPSVTSVNGTLMARRSGPGDLLIRSEAIHTLTAAAVTCENGRL